ncbi:immunoglobulin superfamily member 3-like [Mugil cephalus]|uniref:immunoglobulin superfamily member 3-like n=1 Tax=Mugil cephalus TaxID=48193 RepID=UPI001FB6B3A4|nr:immunoglobulin superfamily member 3-like [Mugil cephalus]
MRCSLHSPRRASLLLCLALFLSCGEASVNIEANAGPLYRVVGSPLIITCTTSGFHNDEAEKHFEIRVTKPSKPNFGINIISTNDPLFGFAVYQRRVESKEITLNRVSPNSVVFEITSLLKGDEGDFECSVINSELSYFGTYSVKTTVKVIDNSLSVSTPDPTSLSFKEGEALTLTCQASTITIQHTHLSVAWNLHKDGSAEAQTIISLNRDFTLTPGSDFERRYKAGDISLDKLGDSTYRLKIAHLEQSDQGKIVCQAQEWIQDPDRSWYSIAQSEAQETALQVKAREVVQDMLSLEVQLSAQPQSLIEGQELMLSCNIDAQNLKERFFSVAWLLGSKELARIGPTGIVTVGAAYSGREKDGELRAARIGGSDYHLVLQPVRTEDQGGYVCRVWPETRGEGGVFIQGEPQDSETQQVSISATESGLSVTMQDTVSVTEGDRLRLVCTVSGVKGQVSITWQRKATDVQPFADVISVGQDGIVEKGGEFKSRSVSATRPTTGTFVLELDEVTPSDSGVYQCSVSEWQTNSKTFSQSAAATVNVVPIESKLSVALLIRKNNVTVGENVQLMCRVKGPQVPVTLTWSVQRDPSTIDNILTVYHNGSISWFGEQNHYQLKVEKNANAVIHSLQIIGASHREAGLYQCMPSVFLENVHKKLPPSNPLAVMVHNPVSKLRLNPSRPLTEDINIDIEMRCSVAEKSPQSSLYAVTWLLQQEPANKIIVRSDMAALVTFGPDVEERDRKRISVKRSKGPTFLMTIHQAKISDGGLYICEVEEWIQDPRGDWYRLTTVSQTTKLSLLETASNLELNKTEQSLMASEGAEVDLQCDVISGASSISTFIAVTWLYAARSSSKANASLVKLDHTGLLSYPEYKDLQGLQSRLRLSRPTKTSFHLTISRAHEGDSGTYWCLGEQYQLDDEGHWHQKASESSGAITLSVNVAENNLHIAKKEVEMNVSRSQNFAVDCHITSQSSPESTFQVTWFWQKYEEMEPRPIFTAYRNSTLQDRLGEGLQLRFGHPVPKLFNLTVLSAAPENSGMYFCEVEEWLPSLDHGLRKVAVEKSGTLTVNVNPEGDARLLSGSHCNSSTWMAITVVIVVVSLLVILVLSLKMCKSTGKSKKKSGENLWANQPINPKIEELNLTD